MNSIIRTSPNPESVAVEPVSKCPVDNIDEDKNDASDNNVDNVESHNSPNHEGETEEKSADDNTNDDHNDNNDQNDRNDHNDSNENQTDAARPGSPNESFDPPQHVINYSNDSKEESKDDNETEQQQPENLHVSPNDQSPRNLHQGSPAHPLNLTHQSPTHSDTPPHPFHRPTTYHPALEQYNSSASYHQYNHHYFNNANNNYSGQPASSFLPGFPHNFSSDTRSEQHEMYGGGVRSQLEPHHSSHLSQLGHLASPFSRMTGAPPGQDPYNFPNSDDEMCSPTRGSNHLSMGFAGMPGMPLLAAPKAQKPRKPRKPRSPKPENNSLPMQIKEDSRRYVIYKGCTKNVFFWEIL